MEKSFEETNRVANRTRAMLGLPQAEGPGGGFLDWGSDYGYQEGSGLAQGISLKDKLLQDLENQNFFIDETNPDPQATMQSMNSYVQKFIGDSVGDQQNNPAFMAGISKYLVEARVEAMVTASNRLEALKLQKQLGNYGTWATSVFTQELPKTKTPQDVREVLSRLTAESQRFGISRDAAADHLASTLSATYGTLFDDAHDNDDLDGMDRTLRELNLLEAALNLPDSAGIPFGGVVKDSNGKLQQPLAPTKRELQANIRQMIGDREKAIKRITEKIVADTSADLLYRLQTSSDMTIGDAIAEVNSLYKKIPSDAYLEIQKFLNVVDRDDMDILEKPGLYEELLLNINNVSLDTLSKHVVMGDLKPSTAKKLAAERQRRKSEQISNLTMANKQASLRNTQLRNQQLQDKAAKEQQFAQWTLVNGAQYPISSLTALKNTYLNLPNANPSMLDTLAQGQQILKQQTDALKEAKAAKEKEARGYPERLVNDFIKANPQYSDLGTGLMRVARDSRYNNPEDMLTFANVLDYPRRQRELKAERAKQDKPGDIRPLAAQHKALYGKLNDDQEFVLFKKLKENPNFEVPLETLDAYNEDIASKLAVIRSYPEGSEESEYRTKLLNLYAIETHPLTSEGVRARVAQRRKELIDVHRRNQ